MPDALGVCGTMCKVKKKENLFWGDSQLPSQDARTKVRLLYLKEFSKVFQESFMGASRCYKNISSVFLEVKRVF